MAESDIAVRCLTGRAVRSPGGSRRPREAVCKELVGAGFKMMWRRGRWVGQEPRELTPNASAAHLFGAELRRWRERQGLSLARLCECFERAGRRVDVGYLARVERGERLPEDRQFAETADALGTTDGLFGRLWDFADAERRDARREAKREREALLELAAGTFAPVLAGDVVFVPYVTGTGTVAYVRVTRRVFLATGGMTPVALAAGVFDPDDLDRLARALERPQASDTRVAAYFGKALELHKTHDFVLDPAPRVGSVVQQIGVLDRFARDARGSVRRALRSVQAEYAEYAGWLHQELGNSRTSVLWTEKASALAQEGGSYQIVTFTMIRRSSIAFWNGQHAEAADLAATAQDGPWPLPPGLASLAAQYEAEAHAALGNASACEARLDRAVDLLGTRDAAGDDQIYWARTHNYDHYRGQRAACLVDLGQAVQAIALLEPLLTTTTANRRGVGGYGHGAGMALLGLAYAQTGQIDAAVHFGSQSLNSTLTTPHRRIIDRLEQALTEWATEESVRQFRRRLDEKRHAYEYGKRV